MKSCPKCLERVGNNADICPFCSHRFPMTHYPAASHPVTARSSSHRSMRACPNCKELNSIRNSRCFECGHAFRDSEVTNPISVYSQSLSNYPTISESWSGGMMVFLVVLTLLIPLVGLIVGAANMSNQARKEQAQALLTMGIFESFLTGLILLSQ